jgi:hypothetical protein
MLDSGTVANKKYQQKIGKETVYKVKIFYLSKSRSKNIINSHLPWLIYFPLIFLKSDIQSKDSFIFAMVWFTVTFW